jgi:hypothetical protein
LFEKITKNVTSKMVKEAKDEMGDSLNRQIPTILGIIAIGIAIFSLMEPGLKKGTDVGTTIINNYYMGR